MKFEKICMTRTVKHPGQDNSHEFVMGINDIKDLNIILASISTFCHKDTDQVRFEGLKIYVEDGNKIIKYVAFYDRWCDWSFLPRIPKTDYEKTKNAYKKIKKFICGKRCYWDWEKVENNSDNIDRKKYINGFRKLEKKFESLGYIFPIDLGLLENNKY